MQHKVDELAEVLSLQLPEGQSYVDLLLAAQERLASETIALASEGRHGWLAQTSPAALTDADDQLLALAGSLRSELSAAAHRTHLSIPTALHLEPTDKCATAGLPGSAPFRRDGSPASTPQSAIRTPHCPDLCLESLVTAALQHAVKLARP